MNEDIVYMAVLLMLQHAYNMHWGNVASIYVVEDFMHIQFIACFAGSCVPIPIWHVCVFQLNVVP